MRQLYADHPSFRTITGNAWLPGTISNRERVLMMRFTRPAEKTKYKFIASTNEFVDFLFFFNDNKVLFNEAHGIDLPIVGLTKETQPFDACFISLIGDSSNKSIVNFYNLTILQVI